MPALDGVPLADSGTIHDPAVRLQLEAAEVRLTVAASLVKVWRAIAGLLGVGLIAALAAPEIETDHETELASFRGVGRPNGEDGLGGAVVGTNNRSAAIQKE